MQSLFSKIQFLSSKFHFDICPALFGNRLRFCAGRSAIVAFCLFAVVFHASSAQAKNMSNRLGVGYKNQFSTDLPGVALEYYPGAALGLSAIIAVDTQKDASKFGLMGKIHRIVFEEDNLNFYMGAGLGLLSRENNGKNDSGFELLGFSGAEFFFPGLENLGFSFEFGVGVTSISSQVRFRTFGDSPLRAGMTFYF
jgi:hypothetical protein